MLMTMYECIFWKCKHIDTCIFIVEFVDILLDLRIKTCILGVFLSCC